MNKIDLDYQYLLKDILENGVKKETRNGGTISVFGRQIRHKMSDGFPLLTTKKMAWKQIVTELLWFLRGDTNIKFLVDNDCHIWTGDAYKNYCKYVWRLTNLELLTQEEFINKIKTDDEFAEKWGELGPIYGKQWRNWGEWKVQGPNGLTIKKGIDQIANLINDLKTNPDSRRLMVNAWNVGELDQMVLPPCHYGFQVYTRELSSQERKDLYDKSNYTKDVFPTDENGWNKLFDEYNIPTRSISLMYNARSQDVPLGTPFNISSYALLLEIIAKMVNMVPDELISNMGDCHIYLNQIDGIKEQLTREPFELPKLVISNQVNFNEGIDEFLNSCLITDFQIEGYQSHPTIKLPLSN
jgi:thymidylate synthase